jgi:hypothetical protein
VIRRNDSLDGQRAAATDQAVLTHLFPSAKINRAKNAVMQPFLFYGTVGLQLWETPDDPKDQDIQLLMPWQITPIPTSLNHPGEARGVIVRKRMPIEEIKKQFRQYRFRRGAITEAERTTVARGDMPGDQTDDQSLIGTFTIDDFFTDYRTETSAKSAKTGSDDGKTDRMEIAWVGAVYLWDERRYLREQIVFVGSKLLFRESFTLTKTYRPITTLHDIDVGSFYGRSWMELQIPINAELEGAIGRTFQNVKNLDMYGFTMVPMNMGVARQAMVAKSGGPKFMPYEWDMMSPGGQNIQQIRPFTSGNFATQALASGLTLSDRMAKQPPMLSGEAPGRVASASALGTLMESSNIPIAPSAFAIAEAFAEIYRAALCRAMKTFDVQDTIAVTMLDDSLVGIVYNPQSGTITLSDSGVAHPDTVEVTVRSMAPVSKQQQKLELENEFDKGRISPTEFRLKARLMNLELPVGNNIEWENYVKARTENALLFHDGKTVPEGSPEQVGVLFSRQADMHEVHLMVHRELVASIKFSLASPAVRKRILDHIGLHEADGMGQIPEGMGNIEDEAAQTLMFQQQGMGGMGGMPMAG